MNPYSLTGLLFTFLIFINPSMVSADITELVKCSDSSAFNARLNSSVKKLEQRLNKYEIDSTSALAMKQQIERTEARFNNYSNSNLYCGSEGLPHLIADGRWNHASEFLLPGVGFIYITGWIGWVGRKYLQVISKNKNPAESEIFVNINVPLAVQIVSTGYIWPVLALQELVDGSLITSEDNISVSPR